MEVGKSVAGGAYKLVSMRAVFNQWVLPKSGMETRVASSS